MIKRIDKSELVKLITEQSTDNDGNLLASQLQLTQRSTINTRNTIASFIHSYKNKPTEQSAVVWLDNEFALYPQLWSSEAERTKAANTITDMVDSYYHHRTELDKHFDKGLSQANWLDEKLRQSAIASGHNNFTEYAGNIDIALDKANQNNINVLYRNDGQINQQRNLDGFIAEQAVGSALLSVGFQAGRIVGRRIWNGLTGKKNPDINEDLQEFIYASIQSTGQVGIAVAVTGGFTVAIKSGWLGKALKNTPVGHIANIVTLGLENSKILYKFSKGELTGKEALDQAGSASVSMVGAIAAAGKLATIGSGLGSVFGPPGVVIGGIVGGVVGGMAGSAVGDGLYRAGKSIVSSVARRISSVSSSIYNSVSSTISSFCSIF